MEDEKDLLRPTTNTGMMSCPVAMGQREVV